MFTLDDRIRGLPAAKEQVVSLYHSINAPNLAIPGKKAGPAQAYIAGLRGNQGYAVFIYLFLPESQDCAVYVADRRNVAAEEYEQQEQEAIAFCESMAFMVDNANFTSMPPEQQDEAIRTMPVFLRDPKLAQPAPGQGAHGEKTKQGEKDQAHVLGRLFSSF